jgi:hypothetical protein
MRPLDPEERAAILSAHPGVTEADLDEYETLLVMREDIEPPPEPGFATGAFEGETQQEREARQKLAEIEARIAEMHARLFPRYREVLAEIARRRRTDEDVA